MKKIKSAKGFIAGVILSGTAFFFINAKSNDAYFEISKNLDIYTNLFVGSPGTELEFAL